MERPHGGEGFEKGRECPQQALSVVLDPKVHAAAGFLLPL